MGKVGRLYSSVWRVLTLHVFPGSTGGIPDNNRSSKCDITEEHSVEPAMFVVWMSVLLLYIWSLSGGWYIPWQEGELSISLALVTVCVMLSTFVDYV